MSIRLLTSSTDPGALRPSRIVVHDINSSSLLGDALLHVKLLFVAELGDANAVIDVVDVVVAVVVVVVVTAADGVVAASGAAAYPSDDEGVLFVMRVCTVRDA